MVSIYGMNREKMECQQMYCHFRRPSKFLEEFSMSDANYWYNVLALSTIFVVLRIAAYFVLRYKLHSIK